MARHDTPLRRGARLALAVALIALLLIPALARAQDGGATARVDVFLEQDLQTGQGRLFFMDALSGLSTVVNVETGRGFALVGNYVIYEKARTGAIMRARADGVLEPHPFIRRGVTTQSVTWAAAPDQSAIAWIEVDTLGVSSAFVAWADGSDLRQLPIDSPAPGLTLLPLALANGMTELFYDEAQPDPLPYETPFRVYSHLSEYQIAREVFIPLPGEPACLCAASVSQDGRILARLEADDGQGPFALHIWDLPTGSDIRIAAPDLNYRLGGDLLLNATGTLAAYTVVTGLESEGSQVPVQYALVLVDVVARRQTLMLDPGPVRYVPAAFIDDDAGLLLTAAEGSGTYKLNLTNGAFKQVSIKTYLGTLLAR